MPFRPTDFTQVNHAMNQALVARAVRLLDAQPGERSSTGSAASATSPCPGDPGQFGARLEGSTTLVERARQAARLNGTDREHGDSRLHNLFESMRRN
jgi:23S rRNA (uracil1939-C5)-methyltransferase